MHFPNTGIGLLTMPLAPAGITARPPARIELRTPRGGFNEAWQFTLLDGNLYVQATAGESGRRTAPLPNCLRGRISAISVDRSRLVALVPGGRVFTLDLANQTPELWWWTARFGSPIWLDPTGSQVRPASRAWILSWLDPEYVELIPFRQQGFWTDSAGKQQPVGGAGVTTVFVLSPEGNRIVILDPWLPGSDPLRISDPEYGENPDRAEAPTNFDAWVGQFEFLRPFFPRYTGIHLPPPAWVRQPKVPGEITSTISIHTFGWQPEGLSDTPRTYHGLLQVPESEWNALSPALRAVAEGLTGPDRAANVMATSNTAEFILRTTEGFQAVLRRS